jgi:hypothetical protein
MSFFDLLVDLDTQEQVEVLAKKIEDMDRKLDHIIGLLDPQKVYAWKLSREHP